MTVQTLNNSKFDNFKVLLVYSNTPLDNLMPVSVSSLSGSLRQNGINNIKLFDTTYYPFDKFGPGGSDRQGSLEVAEFSYKEVGIKFKETNIYDDFRKLVVEYKPDLIGLSTVEPTHLLGMELLNCVKDLNIQVIVGGVYTTFSPENVIQEDAVDMICLGEGEKTIVESKADDSAVSEVQKLRGKKVLLAEDNIVNQKVMNRFLERWEINLFIVENGKEAVEMIKKEDFDLVLMDLQMPVMDGYEATTLIRNLSEPSKKGIPIIALTAAALKEVKEEVYASGMNDFVTKPFNPSELQRKMAAQITS